MDSFKLLADELWKDMVQMGAGTASNRQRRQSYGGYGASGSQPSGGYGGGPSHGGPIGGGPSSPQFPGSGGPNRGGCPNSGAGCCNCKAENTCPEGPAGSPGKAGLDGLPGLPGKDGIPGQDAGGGAEVHHHGIGRVSFGTGEWPFEIKEEEKKVQDKSCFHCPIGPPGLPGPPGRPGKLV
uniref:Uncharacterized protein n=1 Tax=Acrobeloides nanus TaxID=290746 RepID=A0A914CXZ4_9BILA